MSVGQVVGLSATLADGPTVNLSWSEALNAEAYNVERDGSTIARGVIGTTWTDTNPPLGSVQYRVRGRRIPGFQRDPNLRRVAYTCDGNQHDSDDWGASAVALAILSKEYKYNVVHWEYNNHIWNSNTGTLRGGNWEWHSNQSNFVTAEKLGFDTSKFFSCVADGYGVYAAAAKNSLVAAINASTSTDRLVILCAGPMETVWQALDAADPTARTYVDCVSHSTWNEQHAGDTSGAIPHEDGPHGGHNWVDLDPLGCNTIDISDQNGGNKLGDQSSSNFSYFNTGSDPWAHVWTRITSVDGGTTTTDVSDAGMAWYLVNGMVEPATSSSNTYPMQIKTYLGL